jgi:adenylate cyclase
MSLEIERKFLVTTTQYKSLATTQVKITQGYLSKTPERTVRVRVAGDRAWLTIKGIGDAQGMVRKEWEYKIPKEDAIEMLAICEKPLIEKTRYTIPYQSLTIKNPCKRSGRRSNSPLSIRLLTLPHGWGKK